MKLFGNPRVRLAAAAGVAVTLALAGCSGEKLESGGDKGGASGAAVTLKVNFWGDFGLTALKAQYEKDHPNVKISLNAGDFNAQHEDLQKKLVAGSGPLPANFGRLPWYSRDDFVRRNE